MVPQPDHTASVDFLRVFRPSGPWVLTAIEPDQKGIDTRTFGDDQEKELRAWLSNHGQTANIYFSVNPTIRPVGKKASREDISTMEYLHVDIDPRPREDVAAEQARALGLLRGFDPAPTCIVFSGGGYQGFWRLREPVPINGDEAAYEQAKRYNQQLEVLLGGDNCHNVDRIMRLPGTVNRPNAKKRRKGRTEVLAELTEFTADRVYELSRFTPAAEVQSVGSGDRGGLARVNISTGNVQRLASIDDLPSGVSDRVKVAIVQGCDPDEPNRFPSRSEWQWWVTCELCRAVDGDGKPLVSDETIFAVLTDPDFAISSSILDKGSSAEKYAKRQIERAREDAIDPALRELNDKFAVIASIGGKCRVVTEEYDHALKRSRLVKHTFEDFRNRLMHRQKDVGPGKGSARLMMPLGHWWLSNPRRRQYDYMVFAPGVEVPGAYNLWRGFACEARPGCCDKFLEHCRINLCGGNEEYYRYLLGWMASAVQHPDRPGYSAVVLRSGQGTGKGFFAKTFGSLWGRHYMAVADPKFLVGSFNAHLRDCVVLFGDEAFYAGDQRHTGILKTLVTEEMIVVEAKGVDAESAANCVHLILASNEDWVVPADVDDRRFFVLDVREDRKEDHGYFGDIQAELDSGGREALLHLLKTYDLAGYEVRQVPKTDALRRQKIHSFSSEEEWWYQKLQEGKLLVQHPGWNGELLSQDLQNDYVSYTKQFGVSRRSNATRLGHFFRKVVPWVRLEQRSGSVETKGTDGQPVMVQRPYFYILGSLAACREQFDLKFGGPYDWPKVVTTTNGSTAQPMLGAAVDEEAF